MWDNEERGREYRVDLMHEGDDDAFNQLAYGSIEEENESIKRVAKMIERAERLRRYNKDADKKAIYTQRILSLREMALDLNLEKAKNEKLLINTLKSA